MLITGLILVVIAWLLGMFIPPCKSTLGMVLLVIGAVGLGMAGAVLIVLSLH